MDKIERRDLLEDDTLYILPTFLRVEDEMMSALKGSEYGVIFGKKIFTFPQLIERIYEEIPSSKVVISPLGQLVLVERVIDKIYKDKERRYFKSLIRSKSFSKTLRNLINELKSFNIYHEEFEEIVGQLKLADKEKLMEIAAVYRFYKGTLSELELIDHNDVNMAVKDFVADLDNEIVFLRGIHHLKIEDMYDFTPIQFDLIVALAHRIKHTTVIIPYDHDRDDIFRYVERTIRKFESLWELNIDINLDFKPQRDSSQGKLNEITKNYFKRNGYPAGKNPISIKDEVVLIEAAGIYQEAESIGKEIRKLMDGGVKPSKIAVLFKDLAVYSEMIEDVFQRFKIPLYFRRGKPLLSSNVIKTILSIFELLDSNFERDTFLKIMRSNYIDFWAGDEPLAGEKMESYILRAGIIDDRSNGWENMLVRLIARIDKTKSSGEKVSILKAREEREEVEKLKVRIGCVKREIEVFKKKNTIIEFIGILRRLMQSLRIQHEIMCYENEEVLKRDIVTVKKLEEILEEMKTAVKQLVLENESVTYSYFRNLLLEFMEESFILSGRESTHGVKVLNLYESRGLTFDFVFLGGLMEDSFPAKMWQDPFFKDEEKAQFNHTVGKKVFLLKEEKWEEEPLLFYLGLSCAQKRLYLSFSQVDARGRTVLPSLYLNEVMQLVEKKDNFSSGLSRGLTVPQLEECFEKEEIENRLSYNIWRFSLNNEEKGDNGKMRGRDLTASIFNQLITHDQFRRSFKKIFQCAEIERRRELFLLEENIVSRRNKANAWTGLITHEGIKSELKKFFEEEEGHFWSPSHFELYSNCPFRFFLQRLLKIVPLKVPKDEIERVDEGNIVHRVLERFFKLVKEEGDLPIDGSGEEKELIKKIAENIYQKWEAEGYIGNRKLWEIRKKRLSLLWERFIEEESTHKHEEFLPTYFEFIFGNFPGGENKTDMPGLVIKSFNRKEILVGGKVDRVDVGTDKIRVIDYKNSSSEGFYRDLLKREKMGVINFQLPVYLAAVKEYMTEQKKKIDLMEGTFYLFRKSRRIKPYVVKSADFFFERDLKKRMKLKEQGRLNLFNQISEIVERAKSGDYSICPKECTFCDYAHICRFISVDIDEGGE
ncbi:MAG: hypothetical protein AMJ42_01265 [Deltaproteobacteria bacterium DG_8]|nr:MAG: hypothetical protein AMJ42_01265 [Deltaproteobacteria bacterium DG_8]